MRRAFCSTQVHAHAHAMYTHSHMHSRCSLTLSLLQENLKAFLTGTLLDLPVPALARKQEPIAGVAHGIGTNTYGHSKTRTEETEGGEGAAAAAAAVGLGDLVTGNWRVVWPPLLASARPSHHSAVSVPAPLRPLVSLALGADLVCMCLCVRVGGARVCVCVCVVCVGGEGGSVWGFIHVPYSHYITHMTSCAHLNLACCLCLPPSPTPHPARCMFGTAPSRRHHIVIVSDLAGLPSSTSTALAWHQCSPTHRCVWGAVRCDAVWCGVVWYMPTFKSVVI
jgi:hypothetical protein